MLYVGDMADSTTEDSYWLPPAGGRPPRPYRVIGDVTSESDAVQRAIAAATRSALDQVAED
jgi:hypothetical protein